MATYVSLASGTNLWRSHLQTDSD